MDNGTSAFHGFNPKTQLPLEVLSDSLSSATIFIGDNPENDVPEEAVLFLRTDKPAQFKIKVNGEQVDVQKPEYVDLYDRAKNLKNGQKVYAFIIPVTCLKKGSNELSLNSENSETVTIKRLGIALKYGDVRTHGYF